VLRQRLRVSDVRQDLGIPRGRVQALIQGAADFPTVIWEHDFDAIAGHHADMAVRARPDFEAIRAGMRKLYRRFERPLFEICKAGPTGEEADRLAADPATAQTSSSLLRGACAELTSAGGCHRTGPSH